MGYYTRYSMEIQDIDNKGYDSYKIAKYMLDKQEESNQFYAFEYPLKDFVETTDPELGTSYALYLEDSDEVKWYDNEEEMRKLSKKFPDVLFKLHGEGEDNEDIWDKYFMNGKMQYCPAKIMCPPFDRAKLN